MNSETNGIGGKGVSNWATFFKGFKLPHVAGKPNKLPSIVQRIAYLLDWVAKRAPYQYVPYNVVFREINQLTVTPRMSNQDVARLRDKMSAVRPVLQRLYKRDLKNLSGVGIRATVDDLDVVRTTTGAAVRRVTSAHDALKRNAGLVSAAKLPDGPDKAWFVRTVSPAIRALTDDPRMAKLLPPAPTSTPVPASAEKK